MDRGGTALLRANGQLRTLVAARVVSTVGDSLTLVALMLFVADTTGQAMAIALLLLVVDFAPSLFGPLTGVVGDRFDLRRVMVWCEVAQGALVLLIALALPPLPLLLALAGVRALAAQVFLPASRAAVPAVVGPGDLESANALLGFGTNGAEAFGPLAAAALLPVLGLRGVLVADVATFAVSALLIGRLKPIPPSTGATESGVFKQARVGLGYIARTPAVRVVALGFCGVVLCNGVDDVALVLLAKDTLAAGDSAVGLLLAAVGAGLLAGYALLSRFAQKTSMAVLLVGGFLVSSAGNLLTGFAWAVAAAFTVQAVRGLGIAAMDVGVNTLLQRLVPAELLGRVFGNLYGAVGVAAALSYLGGGLLLDATDAPTTFLVAGGGGVVVTVLVAITLPRADRPVRR
ncbi:MFS transporter [Actinokineospora iranica]|uniref:Predicted arabinose efflux permease, MFS family n=1 Tax=Actinokineospora iranica TaxID=1271860 RepID=A0A1G6N878_9PSEU|nr:MFS transporter [Actinokineospora iranica]SDC64013.1 Predicted arabinose efflux permease, MFS family [Actinokineospora iranica]